MRPFVLGLTTGLLALAVGSSFADEATVPASAPALGGYCPVAYTAMHKAVQGDPKVAIEHEGKRYLFANAEAKRMFEADPSRYRVAYDGWCATAISMGKKLASDPKLFTVQDGVTYLFSNADAKKLFDGGPAAYVEKADTQWAILNPALGGYCPVAYTAMHKAVQGDPKVAIEHAGKRYLFTNTDAKKMFEADPAKYRVGYDGWCATAISMGKKLASDPKLFTVQDGVTYLFSSADAKKMFDGDPAGFVEKADGRWAALR